MERRRFGLPSRPCTALARARRAPVYAGWSSGGTCSRCAPPPTGPRDASRASAGSSCSSCLAAPLNNAGVSPPRVRPNAIRACSRSACARPSASSGNIAATASSASAASGAPASNLASAAASARLPRRVGSGVSSAARSRNAAAAANPPRAWARDADCSRLTATLSSAAEDACARCHASRSGSRSRPAPVRAPDRAWRIRRRGPAAPDPRLAGPARPVQAASSRPLLRCGTSRTGGDQRLSWMTPRRAALGRRDRCCLVVHRSISFVHGRVVRARSPTGR